MNTYISPKQRKLARLYIYHERVENEVAALQVMRERHENTHAQLAINSGKARITYEDALSAAIEQGRNLARELMFEIEDLEK